jgi:hypothetical protein
VEPRESNQPADPKPPENPALGNPSAAATAAAPAQPGAADARWWFFLVGVIGALGGILIVLAFVVARSDAPKEVSQPAATSAAPAPPPEVESIPPPTWTGTRQASWANDGTKTIAFELAATRDIPVWMSSARPVLVVRCLSRKTEAFVVLGTSTSYEEDADRRTVRVQWDDDPASVQRWGISQSGRELFVPDGVAFARQMTRANQLRVEFTPFNSRAVTAEFAVQGFERLAGLVAGTCGWRLQERTNRTE